MVREESPPGIAGFATLRVWLLPAVVTAAVTALVVFLVPSSWRLAVALIGLAALGTVVACCAAVARGRRIRELDALVASQRGLLSQQEAATVRLAGVLLPEAMKRLRQGAYHEDILTALAVEYPHEGELTAEFQAAHRQVLKSSLDAVAAEEDLRDSAQRAFVNVARRIQAFVHQQANELREMEYRHGHAPDVFGDLLRIDHGNALIGRLAATIAVLGGGRPGHQWRKPVPLYSVLRGAMGQIIPYTRVDLHSVSEVAVVGPAVAPLIHAVAELLDNATSYSPPNTRVHLTAVEVQSGIAIEIEDAGVSMSEEARLRAERMLQNARDGIDMADLGEAPRLGLAAVGKLAQANDFTVSLRASAYGGVRAVLVVPAKLITTTVHVRGLTLAHGIGAFSGPRTTPSAEPPQSRPATGPVPAGAHRTPGVFGAPAAPGAPAAQAAPRPDSGLPQRRRRAQTVPRHTPVQAAPEPASAPQPGEWLAAFTSAASGDTAPHDTSSGTAGKGEQQ